MIVTYIVYKTIYLFWLKIGGDIAYFEKRHFFTFRGNEAILIFFSFVLLLDFKSNNKTIQTCLIEKGIKYITYGGK